MEEQGKGTHQWPTSRQQVLRSRRWVVLSSSQYYCILCSSFSHPTLYLYFIQHVKNHSRCKELDWWYDGISYLYYPPSREGTDSVAKDFWQSAIRDWWDPLLALLTQRMPYHILCSHPKGKWYSCDCLGSMRWSRSHCSKFSTVCADWGWHLSTWSQ